jgi:hypothetical protein
VSVEVFGEVVDATVTAEPLFDPPVTASEPDWKYQIRSK